MSVHEAAERLRLAELIAKWRERAYAAQKQANIGHYPEGNCAIESTFNECADDLEASIADILTAAEIHQHYENRFVVRRRVHPEIYEYIDYAGRWVMSGAAMPFHSREAAEEALKKASTNA